MFTRRVIASTFLASAISTQFDSNSYESEDEGLHLLQVAAKKHNQTYDQTYGDHQLGRGDGYCAFRGDTHTITGYSPDVRKKIDPMQAGLFNYAYSKDGRFKVQVYQCPVPFSVNVGWLNAMAYDIDGTRIVALPPPSMKAVSKNMPVFIRAGDKEMTSADLPYTIPGTTIELRAHKAGGFHIVTDGFDANVVQISYADAAFSNTLAYMETGLRLAPDNLPDLDENSFCVKGPAATPVADDSPDADWSASLFSDADHDVICGYCGEYNKYHSKRSNLPLLGCAKPPPVPPAPPAKKECEENECSWIHAQQLCHSLQGDDTLYNDCLFDFCLECADHAAVEFVADEEDTHPAPMCVAGAPECAPEDVCTKSVKMNTLTVSQNNLGGVGPDTGAEEIRYSNAAVVDGKAVDLVLTTDGAFKSSKPSKNGNSGAFGVLNVKCGTSVTVSMKVVDSDSGAPVTLDAVALTWYDLDEGKKQKGRATVTTCGSTGAMVSSNTELTVVREGDCSSATSSVAGTGKDNPKSPHALDSVQISRSLTLPFKQVSEFSSTLSLARGFKGRNFLFAIEPSVACGSSAE